MSFRIFLFQEGLLIVKIVRQAITAALDLIVHLLKVQFF
jgi:hypothetical protein